MDYKEINIRVYDEDASSFEERSKNYLQDHIIRDAELFVLSLPGRYVLDLGCGPGRDMAFLTEKGLRVFGLDISSGMIQICKKKGLNIVKGDVERLPFRKGSFDGLWAYTSLLHIPKTNFRESLERLAGLLKDRGILYLGMKEGNFEGFEQEGKYKEKRFHSLYRNEELRGLLANKFSISHFSRVELGKDIYLNYLSKKKLP